MKKVICILLTTLMLVSTASLALASTYYNGPSYGYSWPPEYSPRGTSMIGEVYVDSAVNDRKFVREYPNSKSNWVDVVYPGRTYPCYDIAYGSNKHLWYYIWVEEDNVWGWVSSNVCSMIYYP